MRTGCKLIFRWGLYGLLILVGLSALGQETKKIQHSTDYIARVKHYRYLNPDSALYFVREGIEKAKIDKDSIGLAALLNQNGMIDDNAARYKEARNKYLESEVIYRQIKDDVGLASTLIRLGVVEQRKGNYSKSLAYFFNALKLSEKQQHKLGILEARVTLSETYLGIGDYQNSLRQLDIAKRINEQIPLSNFTLNMYISFGNVYIKQKDYDKAIAFIDTGLSKSHRVEFNGLKISLLTLLAKAYHKKGDDKKAIQLLNEALKFSKEIKNVIRELTCLLDLSEIYVHKGSLGHALIHYKEALRIAEIYKLTRHQINILNSISAIYKNQGNFKEALELLEKSYALADEFYHKDMIKQITSLETAYDLEKSTAQLRQLELINNKEKLFNTVVVYVAIGTFLVLIITFAFFYRAAFLNRLLKKTNKQLEESNMLKDRFFSIVAHDIRSPLVSTISILKLINDDEIDDQMRSEMVQKLALHCENGLDVLDKLLKWGQMQIKGVRLNQTSFNPLPNIERNIALLKEAFEKKDITIKIEVPENLMLNADADHFDFVVRNLIANAIKFTETGGSIKLSAVLTSNNMVKFQVIDNGVGITEVRIKKLFDLSAQGTKGTSSEEGTSLGLMICKEFIEANQGKIQVESVVGVGTTFSFTLRHSL